MKQLIKLNLFIALTVLTCGVTSCKKTYTCTCEIVSPPQGGSGQLYVKAYKKSDADKECNSHSTYLTNSVPPTYETYCSIK